MLQALVQDKAPPAPCGPMSIDDAAADLLRFNRHLLDQALALVAAFEAPGSPPFEAMVGPHLRHVVEHYEALLLRAPAQLVDYDNRQRDRSLERHTGLARARLQALQARLAGWPDAALGRPVRVRSQGGLAGELVFITHSSLGRELVFLASHAVHHFALLKAHCAEHGIATPPHFGQAPSTVAHQLRT